NLTCMQNWWSAYKNMLTHIASYNLPALVNIEPDMTGYAQGLATNNDPATVAVKVASASSDCTGLPDTFVGFASCILKLRDKVATKAYIGFNVSNWFGDQQAIDFMTKMGAGKG